MIRRIVTSAVLTLSALVASTAVSAPAQAAPYSDLTNVAREYSTCVGKVTLQAGRAAPGLCTAAKGHADAASKEAASLFPKSLHNGKGDAFRHCYWNARMTIHSNERVAEAIATNHEQQVKGPAKEKAMDLANNATGRAVGKSSSYGTYAKAKNRCQSLAKNGKLKTLK